MLTAVTDIGDVQDRYAAELADAAMIVLSTMLHGIGAGNMLPAWIPVIGVDINPGSRHQARRSRIGSDDRSRHRVGVFLHQLASQLTPDTSR